MTISTSNKGPLHVLDPNLPFLASNAAIELDNLLLRRKPTLKYVYILSEKLRNSFEIDISNGATRSLIDPTTLTVLGEAVNKSQAQPTVTKVEELIEKACSIASDLSKRNFPKDNREKLEGMRDFCVAFSHLVSAYHKSIFDLRPPHPFRR